MVQVRPAAPCLALAIWLLLAAVPVQAAEPKQATEPNQAAEAKDAVPDVPGDDIFGFTSPTDVGNPGEWQAFNENDGRLGKRSGSYGALNSKFGVGNTFAEQWWLSLSGFTAYNRIRNVEGLDDVSRFQFDGASVELVHRIIERSASNPFAVTLSVEPRWGLVDGVTGLRSGSYGAAFKMFVDAPIVPGTLYWASNVEYGIQRAEDPLDRTHDLSSSQWLLTSAVTWQVTPTLFLGGEVRAFLASDRLGFHEVGRALYAGPTLLWKANDKVALNVTYQPQVLGRARGGAGQAFDLDNFERAQFRAKLAVAF